MLLILSASSFRSKVTSRRNKLDMFSLPAMARDELGLHGLAAPTDLLGGWEVAAMERLRRSADKAACPVLMLFEPTPQALANPMKSEEAMDRLGRVFQAAQRLGAPSVGLTVQAPNTTPAFNTVVEQLKQVMEVGERLGINMLLSPTVGLTQTPDRMTELIKRVGGFRIGSLPDFQAASASGDAEQYLRRLAPYAPVLFGSTVEFDEAGEHTAFDCKPCVRALLDIGYSATIAIDYRGKGDPAQGVVKTRDLLTRLIEEPKE